MSMPSDPHPIPDPQSSEVPQEPEVALLAEGDELVPPAPDRGVTEHLDKVDAEDPQIEIRRLKAALREAKLQQYHLFNRQRHRNRLASKREKEMARLLVVREKALTKAAKTMAAIQAFAARWAPGWLSKLKPVKTLRATCEKAKDWEGDVPDRLTDWRTLPKQEDELGVTIPYLDPTVDIVICVHNALSDVKQCLDSVLARSPRMQQLILVNDGSDAETTAFLEDFVADAEIPVELVHNREARGYTIAANQGLRLSRGDYTVLLNSDTIVTHYWLEALIACGESDKNIGILGPLSNAASWQSVPERFSPEGDWEVNELPEGASPDDLATQLLLKHEPSYPRASLVNGFCYVIKRRVICEIGYLDEETFPKGYGEENDYSLRAKAAGFDLAIADNAYVFHAKSKSFTHSRRRELSQNATKLLHGKHGEARIAEACAELRDDPAMEKAREAARILQPEKVPFRVLYLMDFKGEGGGTHSIAQEVNGLCERGVFAQMAVPAEYYVFYRERYPSFPASRFHAYQAEADLLDYAAGLDMAVATLFTSVALLERIHQRHPSIQPAYYIQDYEPLFYAEEDPLWVQAKRSYSRIPGMLCFAKTQWLCETIQEREGVEMRRVTPSIDRSVYKPDPSLRRSALVLTAMVRPSTPRRSPELTVDVLRSLKKEFGEKVRVVLFGSAKDDPFWESVDTNWTFENRGILPREEVAKVLQKGTLFLDLSTYQAFGRTGLEAMSCGCVALLPENGGVHEYARDGENALVVDTSDQEAILSAARRFIKDADLRANLRKAALETAENYSVDAAVESKMRLFQEVLR